MPSQTIPNATIGDVESALIEQYGRTNVREKSRAPSSSSWTFRITSKSAGKCTATATPSGVAVSMSPHIHLFVIIVTLIGYVLLILPGIIMTIWIAFIYMITAGVISSRFSKMVDSVKLHAQKAAVLPAVPAKDSSTPLQ